MYFKFVGRIRSENMFLPCCTFVRCVGGVQSKIKVLGATRMSCVVVCVIRGLPYGSPFDQSHFYKKKTTVIYSVSVNQPSNLISSPGKKKLITRTLALDCTPTHQSFCALPLWKKVKVRVRERGETHRHCGLDMTHLLRILITQMKSPYQTTTHYCLIICSLPSTLNSTFLQ